MSRGTEHGGATLSTKDTGESHMQTQASEQDRMSTPAGDARALRILAKSVYRELRASGHSRTDIVGFTNALLELVTSDLKAGE